MNKGSSEKAGPFFISGYMLTFDLQKIQSFLKADR
jgi:hypothetical protein